MGGRNRRNRQLACDNSRWPSHLVEVPEEAWPAARPFDLARVLRSRKFLVQVFRPVNGAVRMTVNRCVCGAMGWVDGITWDELQQLKREAGLMCCECGQTIPAGTVLEITRGRYEDDWHEYHTCIGCQRMRDDIMRCGFTHGEVLQDIFDAWCEQLDGDMDEDEQEATEDEIWEALT